MSKGDLAFYILIGLVFEPICFSVTTLCLFAEPPSHGRTIMARVTISALSQALDLYQRDVACYPTIDQGLQALRVNPGINRWGGPYLVRDIPPDPWGRAYLYRIVAEGKPEIASFGRDGKLGGRGDDQDISSLRLNEPIMPSEAEARWEIGRAVAAVAAPAGGLGYLVLPWWIRRLRRPSGRILP